MMWDASYLAANVSQARKDSGRSVAQVAEELDVSRAWVYALESGDCMCSLARLVSLAALLDVEPQWLIQDNGYQPS